MIEALKKLEVILLSQDRIEFLQGLQTLGIVHLEQQQALPDEALASTIANSRQAAAWLEQVRHTYQVSMPAAQCPEDLDALVVRLLDIKKSLADLEHRKRELRYRIQKHEPYGRVDPAMAGALERAGLVLELCSCKITDFPQNGGDAVATEKLGQKESEVYFAAFYHKAETLTDQDKRILSMHQDFVLEDLNLLLEERENLEKEEDSLLRSVIDATRYLDHLQLHIRRLGDMVTFTDALHGLEPVAEGSLCLMTGWFPAANEALVHDFFKDRPDAYFIEQPGQDEAVPVKLRHNWFSRLFAPIMKVYSLPNYHELDTTPFLAPFYTLFFGLCVADVGYGLLLLVVLALVALNKKDNPLRQILGLATVLSLSVLVAGVLLNDYFGFRLDAQTGLGSWLGTFAWFKEQDDAMLLPIAIGIIQVILGYVLRLVNKVRNHGWQGALMPLGVIGLLAGLVLLILSLLGPDFAIGPLPFGRMVVGMWPELPIVFIGGGLLLILFFSHAEHHIPWYKRPLHSLWPLYELATGLPGDILSYLRLFALGLAGGLLAEAVNHIGFMIVEGSTNPLAYMGMVLVLLVGHGLNFGIGLLSAFVHSLRLTFVEFYKAVEFKGGGAPFVEFRLEALKTPDYRIQMKDQLAR